MKVFAGRPTALLKWWSFRGRLRLVAPPLSKVRALTSVRRIHLSPPVKKVIFSLCLIVCLRVCLLAGC